MNAKKKGQQPGAAELASIATSNDGGRQAWISHRHFQRGRPRRTTARPSRSVQEARNRRGQGVGAADPGKRLYGPSRGRLREGAESYAKALASDILR